VADRLHEAGLREHNMIRIKEVSASRGKVMRAENRVLDRRGLDQLEGEMLSFSREWDRQVDGSRAILLRACRTPGRRRIPHAHAAIRRLVQERPLAADSPTSAAEQPVLCLLP
jgi:hypothetical protein